MNELSSYFNMLINEYANKPQDEGYHLDVESLPHNELASLIEVMMKHDNHMRDIVLSHIQESIESHIPNFEINHRYYQQSA